METLKLRWTGIRPLIMSNPQTVQISCPYSVKSRRLNSDMKKARKAEKEDNMVALEAEQQRNDWESSAYWDDKEKSFFVPDTMIIACIRDGATAARQGKDIDRAVMMVETQAFIPTKHKSLEAAFQDPEFRLAGPCKIPPKKGSLVWKWRCMIPTGWKLQFSLEYDGETFKKAQTLIDMIEMAGRMRGIGGWRPKFGRFLVEVL